MKKITQLAVALLLTCSFSLSTVKAQSPKKMQVKSKSVVPVKMVPKAKPVKVVKQDVKTQLLGEWKFHELTLRAAKDGYLPHIAAQEVNIIKLLIANYTFNADGSITLDPKYIEKQGVKSAEWKWSDTDKLIITHFLSAEKMKAEGYSESANKVEIKYKVNIITGKELTLSWNDMFIVNLIRKNKK